MAHPPGTSRSASCSSVSSVWPATRTSTYGRAAAHAGGLGGEAVLARVRVHPHHPVGEPLQPRHLLGELGRVAALPPVAGDHDDRTAGRAALAPAVEEGLELLAEPGAAAPVGYGCTRGRSAASGVADRAARGRPGSAGCPSVKTSVDRRRRQAAWANRSSPSA